MSDQGRLPESNSVRPDDVSTAEGDTYAIRRRTAHQNTVPVPRSNVAVEPVCIGADRAHLAVVRCRSCNRRAFDVVGLPTDIAPQGSPRFAVLGITRRCRRCDRLQDGQVTGRSGYPLLSGLDGIWRCECGHALGVVAEVRGRVKVRCRCGLELRSTAADVIDTAEAARIADAS